MKFVEFQDEHGNPFLVNAEHIHRIYGGRADGKARLHLLTDKRDSLVDLSDTYEQARHALRVALG